MSGTIRKFVLPSLLASSAVFTALSFPLVVYGSEPIDSKLAEGLGVSDAVVMKDFAAPYLGLAGLVSLAVGGVGLTLSGIGHSKRQSSLLAAQVEASQQVLKGREAEIQSLLMSDKGLNSAGLGFFLDDIQPLAQATTAATVAAAVVSVPQEIFKVAPVAAVPSIAISALPVAPTPSFIVNATVSAVQPVRVPQVTVQTSSSPMPAAHGFLGFTRSSGQALPSAAIEWLEQGEIEQKAETQLNDVQAQLQVLMTQIEQLQSSLKPQAVPTSRIEVITQAETPKNTVASHRFQPFEHAWSGAAQRAA